MRPEDWYDGGMWSFLFLFLISLAGARDLTGLYRQAFDARRPLMGQDIRLLRNYQFALVPGILAESFIEEDSRSTFEFSDLTSDYFGSQLRYLESKAIPVKRVRSSSLSVEQTVRGIDDLVKKSKKKVFFISHSLGGMGLLDYLLQNEGKWDRIAGIIFIQSPFRGAPVASVLSNSPWIVKKFLEGAMFFFNTSEDTLNYLSMENRKEFITQNSAMIARLVRAVPILTVGGIANGHVTLFSSSANVIRHGCLTPVFGRCLVKVFDGPYDDNDGMVPFESSRLPEADFVKLKGVDHGETVVNDYVNTIDRGRMTEALLKIFLPKLSQNHPLTE